VSKFKAILAAGLCATAFARAELTTAEFDKLHKELTGAREAWQAIPWQLSLVQACKQAAKENKPVYMLCRSGHPLGCV
jgi:riboflavin synthase